MHYFASSCENVNVLAAELLSPPSPPDVHAGIGISANKHSTIFQPFEQGDNSRTRAHGGTGLGLSLARSLVEAHDGTLTVRSELKKGSTFCVLLPLKSKSKSAKTEVIGGPKKSMDAVSQAETVDQVASAPQRLTKSGSGRMNRNDPGQVERSLPSKSSSNPTVRMQHLRIRSLTVPCSDRPCTG